MSDTVERPTETPHQFTRRVAAAWRVPAAHLSATLTDLPEAYLYALTPQVAKAMEGKLPVSYGLIGDGTSTAAAIAAVISLGLEAMATRSPGLLGGYQIEREGLWIHWSAVAPRAAMSTFGSENVTGLSGLLEDAARVKVLVVTGIHATQGRTGAAWDAALVGMLRERIDRGPTFRTYFSASAASRLPADFPEVLRAAMVAL